MPAHANDHQPGKVRAATKGRSRVLRDPVRSQIVIVRPGGLTNWEC